jgi:hypothetical protein
MHDVSSTSLLLKTTFDDKHKSRPLPPALARTRPQATRPGRQGGYARRVNFAQLLFPDFSLILCGYLLCRFTALNRSVWQHVDSLVYYFLFPLLLFHSIVKSPIDLGAASSLIAAGLFYGGDMFNVSRLMVQLLGAAAAFAWAFPVAYVFFKAIDKAIGLRAPTMNEQRGLDYTEHHEIGYPEFQNSPGQLHKEA